MKTFERAAEEWIARRAVSGTRARYLAAETVRNYRQYISAVNRSFAKRQLSDITPCDIRAYQAGRAAEGVSAGRINQETMTLVAVMKANDAWTAELARDYEPMRAQPSDIPRALTRDEQDLWLRTAKSRKRWAVVYLYSVIALRTTASHVEMRGLRVRDINLHGGTLTIQGRSAKNPYRVRTIPLTPDAQEAAALLLDRARSLGAVDADHYVFPIMSGYNTYDPTTPATTWAIRKPWNEVRRETGLKWFRPHDCRHTAITRLAEAGTPFPVIMSMAGHMSSRMTAHYTHVSVAAQKQAVNAAFERSTMDLSGAAGATGDLKKLIALVEALKKLVPADLLT